jgi:hypothetical protein
MHTHKVIELMTEMNLTIGSKVSIQKSELNHLITLLTDFGYETIGPKIHNQAISYAVVEHLEDLPQGYSSEQERGYYRLH